jgi:hypothetical protein
MRQPVLVAFAATLVADGLEIVPRRILDLVRVWQSVQTGPRWSPLASNWPWTLLR